MCVVGWLVIQTFSSRIIKFPPIKASLIETYVCFAERGLFRSFIRKLLSVIGAEMFWAKVPILAGRALLAERDYFGCAWEICWMLDGDTEPSSPTNLVMQYLANKTCVGNWRNSPHIRLTGERWNSFTGFFTNFVSKIEQECYQLKGELISPVFSSVHRWRIPNPKQNLSEGGLPTCICQRYTMFQSIMSYKATCQTARVTPRGWGFLRESPTAGSSLTAALTCSTSLTTSWTTVTQPTTTTSGASTWAASRLVVQWQKKQ